jgi:hypothetical protein
MTQVNIIRSDDIYLDGLTELAHSLDKFPVWPTDPIHAVQVVNEEVGELNRAILQLVYEPDEYPDADVRKEAIQSIAVLIRFIAGLDGGQYNWSPAHQVEQVLEG